MWTFRNNFVVAAYPVFVYVVSRAGRHYAIETCRSSERVLESDLKINDIQLVHMLVVW